MNKDNKHCSMSRQAAASMMFVLLIHNIVRSLPGVFGSVKFGDFAKILVCFISAVLALGIVLVLLKKKAGLFLGILNGAYIIFQPVFVHIIKGHPDINGIWWYPLLPWTIGVFIIYFCSVTWKEWNNELKEIKNNE